MSRKPQRDYTDFSNVRSLKNELIPEEFPEGAFGLGINENAPVESKSTPWEKGQRRQSAYIYTDKEFHEDIPRQAPGAHPLHDAPDEINSDKH